MSKWINFNKEIRIEGKKTDTYTIWTKTVPPVLLGEIRWFGNWRKYSFFPREDTVYENICLRDIADFCVALMGSRITAKKAGGINET